MKSRLFTSMLLCAALLPGLFPVCTLAAPNDATVGAASSPPGKKDYSRQLYTRQSDTGATVLGNGEVENGDTALRLQGAPVVGGTGVAIPTAGRLVSAAATAAVNGQAPSVDYASNAANADLKARDEKLATRVAQMYHRRSAFNTGTVTPASPAGH